MVTRMERSALSTSLIVLLVLFIVQFFTGMTMNLLIALPTNIFPSSGGSIEATFKYIITGGNPFLLTHFAVDTAIIGVGVVNLALVIRKRKVYIALSAISLASVLSAFVNGERFVASNFAINGISFGMAGAFLLSFILYFTMAMLMYRDLAVIANGENTRA